METTAHDVTRWYALYTCSRHEKKVARQLAIRQVDHYLPLYDSVRRWKDRRMSVEMPLFPGYIFVKMRWQDRLQALQVPGVVSLVGNNGPTALPEEEIESIRRGMLAGASLEPHPYLRVGRRVRVRNGPLAGTEGILVRKRGGFRVVISVDLINRSVAAEVEECDLEPVVAGRCMS